MLIRDAFKASCIFPVCLHSLQNPRSNDLPRPPTPLFLLQVVVKTRTEYQTEKKRLKVPKVEEFTISFTDGVSERLKVSARRLR